MAKCSGLERVDELLVDVVESAIAQDTEDVAGLGLRHHVGDDLVGGWEVIRLDASGANIRHELGGIEAFLGRHLLEPGDLGHDHAAFRPSAEGKEDMTLNGITLERLSDRKKLLQSFDQLRRDVDNSGLIEGMDAYNQQAFGMLTSGKLADALDLEKEDVKLRDRYGRGTAKLQADGAPKLLDHFLLARRLVEVGVRCVSLSFSRWDWHGGNFRRARQDFPMLDQGLTALIEDLHQRGLDKDVVVVCWGEFGRTPTINKDAGRDHWPRVSCGLLACGGLKHGQVIGATDRLGGEASERPVTFGEVHATLYHALGIDPNTTTVNDLNGRPHYLVENNSQPLHEVV